jgi:hypothetical protein
VSAAAGPDGSGRATARARQGEPRPGGGGRPDRQGRRPALSVLDRKALLERVRQRRVRLLLAASGLLVAGSLGTVAAAQGLVTSQQLRLDQIDQQIVQQIGRTQQLQVTRATLDAPSRVLGIAEHGLHMVTPSSVTYLTPTAPATPSGRGRP